MVEKEVSRSCLSRIALPVAINFVTARTIEVDATPNIQIDIIVSKLQ